MVVSIFVGVRRRGVRPRGDALRVGTAVAGPRFDGDAVGQVLRTIYYMDHPCDVTR